MNLLKLDCDIFDYHHCLVKIPNPKDGTYMIADLTSDPPVYGIYHRYINHWSDGNKYIETGYVDYELGEMVVYKGHDEFEYDEEKGRWILK